MAEAKREMCEGEKIQDNIRLDFSLHRIMLQSKSTTMATVPKPFVEEQKIVKQHRIAWLQNVGRRTRL